MTARALFTVTTILPILLIFGQASCSHTPIRNTPAVAEKRTALPTFTAVLDGIRYVNKGLVGFGLIPSDIRDSTGDTIGGIGSAIAFKVGSWRARQGQFTGTLVVQPDRGFNLSGTIDYQSRLHEIDFILTPYYGSVNLNFTEAQQTLRFRYKKTILGFERNNTKTSGLDPAAVRPAQVNLTTDPFADPEMPVASTVLPHLSIDAEGLVVNADGSFWTSDEYGPYIYHFSPSGELIQTIQPPSAFLPRDASGSLFFTSESDPVTGRASNQGFEGLTLDPKSQTLYAMAQSALVQDGGAISRYTRLLAYDVSDPSVHPPLVGEWVIPLSLSSTRGCNEIQFVSPGVFLAMSRDGDGRDGDDDESAYRQADLFSIANATDIHGTKFDDPKNPIASGGILDSSIVPATYVPFVNFIEPAGLERFGVHNGSPNDHTLLNAKWESLAITSAEDPAHPDDFFLFSASDNDFVSTNGVALGMPFDAGLDVDNQFLVFRVTLPGATDARK